METTQKDARMVAIEEKGRREHGEKFDSSDLAPQFLPFYPRQQRIKVRSPYGEEITGLVGKTTGWRPSFLLMRRANAISSSTLLGHDWQIVATQDSRGKYIPTTETCRHCGRPIVFSDGLWIDPEASGDDIVWRETCDSHDTFTAEHEPAPN